MPPPDPPETAIEAEAKAGQKPKDAVKHASGQKLGERETLSREQAAKLAGTPWIPSH